MRLNTSHRRLILAVCLSLLVSNICATLRQRQFTDLNLSSLNQEFSRFTNFPGFVQVSNAEKLFGFQPLTAPGMSCSPIIARATHFPTLVNDNERPQIFLSGAFHGDERVGPSVVTETLSLLLEASLCTQDPPHKQAQLPEICSALDTQTLRWLRYLLVSRDTFFLPAVNCIGFGQRTREELHIDPNRDFPFEQSPDKSRVINELFLRHLFQVAVTFHGGMEAISWVWGSPSHKPPGDVSPDDIANSLIGQAMRRAAGKTYQTPAYRIGRMSRVVYPVSGGMEDWAYGASWSHQQPACKASDYPEQRTTYDKHDLSFRSLVYLVETSNRKSPAPSVMTMLSCNMYSWLMMTGKAYGSMDEVFTTTSGSGHVSRNIKLTLMAMELAQPYVCFNTVKLLKQTQSEFTLSVSWYVGGALKVDQTMLALHAAANDNNCRNPTSKTCTPTQFRRLVVQPNNQTYPYPFGRLNHSPPRGVIVSQTHSGYGWKNPTLVWDEEYQNGAFPISPMRSATRRTLFTSHVTIPKSDAIPGKYWLVAWAKVDQMWRHKTRHAQPDLPPQSHLVNARTNRHWTVRKGDREIRGRLYWPSMPLLLEISIDGNVNMTSSVLYCELPSSGDNMILNMTSGSPINTLEEIFMKSSDASLATATSRRYLLVAVLGIGAVVALIVWGRRRFNPTPAASFLV